VAQRRMMSPTDMGIVGATTDSFILFENGVRRNRLVLPAFWSESPIASNCNPSYGLMERRSMQIVVQFGQLNVSYESWHPYRLRWCTHQLRSDGDHLHLQVLNQQSIQIDTATRPSLALPPQA
jgi:hypothetical protein